MENFNKKRVLQHCRGTLERKLRHFYLVFVQHFLAISFRSGYCWREENIYCLTQRLLVFLLNRKHTQLEQPSIYMSSKIKQRESTKQTSTASHVNLFTVGRAISYTEFYCNNKTRFCIPITCISIVNFTTMLTQKRYI